ncbi:hypothetical protein ARMSODRAFT_900334, partial [Armillaria solidipes]
KPFVQLVMFDRPRGEVVRLPASVDDSALVGIMCATKYDEVAHRLGALRPSFKKLRMANGALVLLRGSWEGMMTFGPAKAKVAFEVFANSGNWSFLFGKPLLEQFQAVHDYVDDTISVPGPNGHVIFFTVSPSKSKPIVWPFETQ